MMRKISWGAVIIDGLIIVVSAALSAIFKDGSYLWLLLLLIAAGGPYVYDANDDTGR